MLKRFFTILQRNWTYEMEYSMEIARIIFINLVTIALPAILYRIPDIPQYVFWAFGVGPASVFWWYYIRYSIGRMIQIKNNKKYAQTIVKSQFKLLENEYLNQAFYLKINGKYRKLVSSTDVDDKDKIILICIGNKPVYELKKINKILKKDDNS